MGYACPVCEDPQADAEHLANHLAFTALLGDADHESWLDEHVPDWEQHGESELAARVTDFAEEEEFPQVFDDTVARSDTTGHSHDHDERSGALFEDDAFEPRGQGGIDLPRETPDPEMDEETARVVEEAREMTRKLLEEREADGEGEDGNEDGDGDDA
ncbi:MAG: DUF5810 domain-containing protein [Haloarculaceae archaeon]